MGLDGRFRKHGERRTFRVLNDDCLAASCFDPVVLLDHENNREHCSCRTLVSAGCPDIIARGLDANLLAKRQKQWVKA